jgi:hypothetical protein
MTERAEVVEAEICSHTNRPTSQCALPNVHCGYPGCVQLDPLVKIMAKPLAFTGLGVDTLVKAQLTALTAAGYKLAGPDEVVVPEEPTNKMLDEGLSAYGYACYNNTLPSWNGLVHAYAAMLKAAEDRSEKEKRK